VVDVYGRRLVKLNEVLQHLGDIPAMDGIKKLWIPKMARSGRGFLNWLAGRSRDGFLSSGRDCRRASKRISPRVRVLDALRRAEELLKKSSSINP
jgi:hypothetical protein